MVARRQHDAHRTAASRALAREAEGALVAVRAAALVVDAGREARERAVGVGPRRLHGIETRQQPRGDLQRGADVRAVSRGDARGRSVDGSVAQRGLRRHVRPVDEARVEGVLGLGGGAVAREQRNEAVHHVEPHRLLRHRAGEVVRVDPELQGVAHAAVDPRAEPRGLVAAQRSEAHARVVGVGAGEPRRREVEAAVALALVVRAAPPRGARNAVEAKVVPGLALVVAKVPLGARGIVLPVVVVTRGVGVRARVEARLVGARASVGAHVAKGLAEVPHHGLAGVAAAVAVAVHGEGDLHGVGARGAVPLPHVAPGRAAAVAERDRREAPVGVVLVVVEALVHRRAGAAENDRVRAAVGVGAHGLRGRNAEGHARGGRVRAHHRVAEHPRDVAKALKARLTVEGAAGAAAGRREEALEVLADHAEVVGHRRAIGAARGAIDGRVRALRLGAEPAVDPATQVRAGERRVRRPSERREDIEELRVVRADHGRADGAHGDAVDRVERATPRHVRRAEPVAHHRAVGAEAVPREGHRATAGVDVRVGDGDDARTGGRSGRAPQQLDVPLVERRHARRVGRNGEAHLPREARRARTEGDGGTERVPAVGHREVGARHAHRIRRKPRRSRGNRHARGTHRRCRSRRRSTARVEHAEGVARAHWARRHRCRAHLDGHLDARHARRVRGIGLGDAEPHRPRRDSLHGEGRAAMSPRDDHRRWHRQHRRVGALDMERRVAGRAIEGEAKQQSRRRADADDDLLGQHRVHAHGLRAGGGNVRRHRGFHRVVARFVAGVGSRGGVEPHRRRRVRAPQDQQRGG